MRPLISTQIELEPQQKTTLLAQAKHTGRSVSELVRDANDAAIAGVTTDDLKTLDQGTKKAQTDIQFMLSELKTNSHEHSSFMRDIQNS